MLFAFLHYTLVFFHHFRHFKIQQDWNTFQSITARNSLIGCILDKEWIYTEDSRNFSFSTSNYVFYIWNKSSRFSTWHFCYLVKWCNFSFSNHIQSPHLLQPLCHRNLLDQKLEYIHAKLMGNLWRFSWVSAVVESQWDWFPNLQLSYEGLIDG